MNQNQNHTNQMLKTYTFLLTKGAHLRGGSAIMLPVLLTFIVLRNPLL